MRPQVFFAEIEFGKSAEVFGRLNTKSLPYVFHIAPGFSTEGDGTLRIAHEDVMQVGAPPPAPPPPAPARPGSGCQQLPGEGSCAPCRLKQSI